MLKDISGLSRRIFIDVSAGSNTITRGYAEAAKSGITD